MIFSSGKWNSGREIRSFVNGSAGMEYIVFEPHLQSTFDGFIEPLLGNNTIARLLSIYDKTDSKDNEKKLLRICQQANANLAIWYGFNELNSVLSDDGVQRVESDSHKSLYKYQERTLKNNYRDKGFNALDRMLSFLETNVSDFPEYKTAETYTFHRSAIVPNANTVSRYVNINNSRIIFLSLLPHLNFVQQTKLLSFVGNDLFNSLLIELKKEDPDSKIVKLRELLQPVIVCHAVSRYIVSGGSLTDRGLYFSSVVATNGNDESSTPADSIQIERQAKQLVSDATEYMTIAERFIKEAFPQLYRDKSGNVLDFDNDARKIFIA